MKQLFSYITERFEALAMATAFAEVGEWTTAQEIMDRRSIDQQKTRKRQSQKNVRRRPEMRL